MFEEPEVDKTNNLYAFGRDTQPPTASRGLWYPVVPSFLGGGVWIQIFIILFGGVALSPKKNYEERLPPLPPKKIRRGCYNIYIIYT